MATAARAAAPGRRTNSLGSAKTDCHTCSALRRRCDRQRPRCRACLDTGITCKGFSMPLSWQKGLSVQNKPARVKKSQASSPNSPVSASSLDEVVEVVPSLEKPREFKFVAGRASKRQKRGYFRDERTSEKSPGRRDSAATSVSVPEPWNESNATFEHVFSSSVSSVVAESGKAVPSAKSEPRSAHAVDATNPWHPSDNYWVDVLSNDPVEEVPLPTEIQLGDPIISSLPVTLLEAKGILEREFESWHCLPDLDDPDYLNTDSDMSTDLSLALSTRSRSPFSAWGEKLYMSIAPPICHANLADKFAGLLNMYDEMFCDIPITSDFFANPYRFRPETSRGSRFLLHAILALSCHYSSKWPVQSDPPDDAMSHRNTAIVLYSDALDNDKDGSECLSLLDTTLTLWQVFALETSLNDWHSQLARAYRLLELSGGVKVWSQSVRAQTQVSMLLWWDSCIAILSRQGCTMPYAYFEAVLMCETRYSWTFFTLNGCPRELIVPMMQLANLAAKNQTENHRNSPSQDPAFDASVLISEIETSIKNYTYTHPELMDLADEESMQLERDCYHCCEAFRHALLIYIIRVFRWKRGEPVSGKLRYLSRVTIDHMRSCRPTSVIQKQVLLPAFLAGAEAADPLARQSVLEYCKWWFAKYGYQMYTSVPELLEQLWAEQDAGRDTGVWWGDIVDRMQGGGRNFCFG